MIILGIDPGLKGALAYWDTDSDSLEILDMPTHSLVRNRKTKNEIDAYTLAHSVDIRPTPDVCVLERVGAAPGQGVTSMFSFGKSVGILIGILASNQFRIEEVTPQQWQRTVQVRGGKDGSRARAAALFPKSARLFSRKMDDGRADAALIARYGLKILTEGV